MQTVNLDKIKVKQVTNASKTATATMILLGFRQRAHSTTVLSAVKNQLLGMDEKVNDKDFMDFWRGLETAHVGSIILGRRGKQTRFEWNYSLRSIAQMAIEGKEQQIEKLAVKQRAKPVTIVPGAAKKLGKFLKEASFPKADSKLRLEAAAGPKKEERLVYKIQVRPDYTLEVNLPGDLSEKELAQIRNSFTSVAKVAS